MLLHLALLLSLPAPSATQSHGTLWQRIDVDRDGQADLFHRGGQRPARLLRGLGRAGFEDATERAGLAALGALSAAAWIDLDGDGAPELISGAADGALRLWHNDGSGGFLEVAQGAGLEPLDSRVESLSWLDLDGDGREDLLAGGARDERCFLRSAAGTFQTLTLPDEAPILRSLPDEAASVRALPEAQRVPVPATGEVPLSVGGTGSAPPLPLMPLCAPGVADLSTGQCLPASSMPQLGALLPLSKDFNLDLAGNVGLGTTSPTARLDVVGGGRFSGALEGDLLRSNAPLGLPPLSVFSTTTVPNLSADLLDGFDSSAFSQLGGLIETGELADKAVTTQKLATKAVTGNELAPDAVNTVHLADGAVTSASLAAAAVTPAHMNTGSALPNSVLAYDGSSAAWTSLPAAGWTPIAGLPFTISQPGAYYLTGDLSATTSGTGILVQVNDVVIDLMGYTLDGVGLGSVGVGGIVINGRGLRVRNGTLRGWTLLAVGAALMDRCELDELRLVDNIGGGASLRHDARVRDCLVADNGSHGVKLGDRAELVRCRVLRSSKWGVQCDLGARLVDCTAEDNLQDGYVLDADARLERCVAIDNKSSGFVLGLRAQLLECTASENGLQGFDADDGARLQSCRALANSDTGFLVESDSSVLECEARDNGQSGITAGGGCTLLGNSVSGSGQLNPNPGILVHGSRTRIEGNHIVGGAGSGLAVTGSNCVVLRNTCGGNAVEYSFNGSGLVVGPILTGATVPTSNNPHANYEF